MYTYANAIVNSQKHTLTEHAQTKHEHRDPYVQVHTVTHARIHTSAHKRMRGSLSHPPHTYFEELAQ